MSAKQVSARGIESLRARRKRARRRLSIFLAVLLVVIIGTLIWLAWQPYFRISSIEVFDADQSLAIYAKNALAGSYFGIVPRDSYFFVPESKIRTEILEANPQIAAVSIFHAGATSLSIKVSERVPIARWCGATYDESASTSPQAINCYLFDASGYLYATATSDTGLNSFAVYQSLTASSSDPIGATLASASALPDAFAFARSLNDFGSPVESVVVRSDEVDDLLASGTRITYVLGQEQQAYSALDSAKSTMDLSDGSVAYVDLRFPGDIYVKQE